MTGGKGRGKRRMSRPRPTASQLAVAAACLFGAAGLMWAFLPMSEAGGYYGERDGAAGRGDAIKAEPLTGSMTVNVESADGTGAAGVRGVVESLARDIVDNWASGTITGDEYIAAMSYMHRSGYLDVDGAGRAWDGGSLSLKSTGYNGSTGPAGSAQKWCKDGLAARTDAHTGDMVCVPDEYADEAVRLRWIEPIHDDGGGTAAENVVGSGIGGAGAGADNDGDNNDDGNGISPTLSAAPEAAWQWKPRHGAAAGGGEDGYGNAYTAELKERIADLEDLNAGLLRTVARLQEALMEIHTKGNAGGRAVAVDSGAIEAADGDNDGICLHGTDASFTAVIDPDTLAEAGGVLGTIPVPEGRYTVLLTAASSSPVSVRVQLVGDAGLAYDRKFILADTGRPPGEDSTLWDYNSGRAELDVPVPQLVNATAIVQGGDGMPVFASVSRCR